MCSEANALESNFLTVDEVAEQLRVSATTVRRWINESGLVAYKPGRRLLIRERDLEAWLTEQRVSEAMTG